MCQRHQNRLYASTVSLNNIHQCGAMVLKFQCYSCHSSVVCSLHAPRKLNNRVLKLFHSYSSYILTSLACGVFTNRFTVLFFLLILQESLFQRFLPFHCLRVTVYCLPVKQSSISLSLSNDYITYYTLFLHFICVSHGKNGLK
jgi:hypothetical protein